MVSTAHRADVATHAPEPGALGWQELVAWLESELEKRVPETAHAPLAASFVRALAKERREDGSGIGRVILKQETWRLLIASRATGLPTSQAVREFEAFIPRLATRVAAVWGEEDQGRRARDRMEEALEELRGWPLV